MYWLGSMRLAMVPRERLELSRGYPHQILSLARLPVPPSRHDAVCLMKR